MRDYAGLTGVSTSEFRDRFGEEAVSGSKSPSPKRFSQQEPSQARIAEESYHAEGDADLRDSWKGKMLAEKRPSREMSRKSLEVGDVFEREKKRQPSSEAAKEEAEHARKDKE